MKRLVGMTAAVAALLLFQGATDAAAQGSLNLPVTGTAAQAATFSGTVAVTRFETRGGQIVAVGFLRGTLTQRNRTFGTALVGEVAIPVSVRAGGATPVDVRAAAYPQLRRIALSTTPAAGSVTSAQDACPVVDIVLGPFTANVLGVDVAVQPIDIQTDGSTGHAAG